MTLAFIIGAGWLWINEAYSQTRHRESGMSVGIGASTSLKGSCGLTIEHPIADRWSLSASAGFSITPIRKGRHRETLEHLKEFEDIPKTDSLSMTHHRESFSFSYWPMGTGKGVSVSIGAEYLSTEGFDAICGLSYRIPIWKGLSAALSCRFRCIGPMIYGNRKSGAAGVDIFYRF